MHCLDDYFVDLVELLKQEALAAKAEVAAEEGKSGHQFALGRLMAFHQVLSLIRDQGVAFGLNAETVPLRNFDVDRELLS